MYLVIAIATAYLLVGAYLAVKNLRAVLRSLSSFEMKSSDRGTERGMRLGMVIGAVIYAAQLLIAWPLVLLRRLLRRRSADKQALDFSFSISRPRSPHTVHQEQVRMWELVADESDVFDAYGSVTALLVVAWKVYSREVRSSGLSQAEAQGRFIEYATSAARIDLSTAEVHSIAEQALVRAREQAESAEGQIH